MTLLVLAAIPGWAFFFWAFYASSGHVAELRNVRAKLLVAEIAAKGEAEGQRRVLRETEAERDEYRDAFEQAVDNWQAAAKERDEARILLNPDLLRQRDEALLTVAHLEAIAEDEVWQMEMWAERRAAAMDDKPGVANG